MTMPTIRRMTVLAVAALAVLCAQAQAASSRSTGVLFSFGKVEVLRARARRWEFVHVGAPLGPRDLVRMPPGSLLRLTGSDGTRYALLNGARENTVEVLLDEAKRGNRKLASEGGETAVIDVLPAGDATTRPKPAALVRFSEAEMARWVRDDRHRQPLVRKLAEETIARVGRLDAEGFAYPTPRLRTVQALYEAARDALRSKSAVGALFPEGDAAPAYLLAALLGATDIPFQRNRDEAGRPVLLVELDLAASESARLTANRSAYRGQPNGRVLLPLCPALNARSFLEAWFAAENPSFRIEPTLER